MAEFDPEKFDEKYVHYFEELEAAYSRAYRQLHGHHDSRLLRGVDRRILSESEPVYEGNGEFRLVLPDDVDRRLEALGEPARARAVLDALVEAVEAELQRTFEFDQSD